MIEIRAGYSAILDRVSRKAAKNSKVLALFNKNEEAFKSTLSNEDLLKRFYANSILRYCLYVYAYKQSFDREFNWIDIENELLKLLTELHSENFSQGKIDQISITLPRCNSVGTLVKENFYISTVVQEWKTKNIPSKFVRQEVFKYLFKELEDFSLMLKLYLQLVRDDFYSSETPKVFQINSQDFDSGIFVDSVLSFNYTDTVKIYMPEAPIYFVNGSLEDKKIGRQKNYTRSRKSRD